MKTTKAVNEFINLNSQIQAELAELQAKVDNHHDTDPDSVNWGHVGSLQSILNLLKEANGKVD